tara:strand:+ start:76 stop:600 length:525 start_codon:yes stop_codon:yes gene_type:complete
MNLKEPKLLKNFFKSYQDERGLLNPIIFERLFEIEDLSDFILKFQLMSFTENANTFRGFHYQRAPFQQAKILIVHKGQILDIVFPAENLTKQNIKSFDLNCGDVLLIPENYAHGFYTKSANTILQYLLNEDFSFENYTGFNGTRYIQKITGKNKVIISEHDIELPLNDKLEGLI